MYTGTQVCIGSTTRSWPLVRFNHTGRFCLQKNQWLMTSLALTGQFPCILRILMWLWVALSNLRLRGEETITACMLVTWDVVGHHRPLRMGHPQRDSLVVDSYQTCQCPAISMLVTLVVVRHLRPPGVASLLVIDSCHQWQLSVSCKILESQPRGFCYQKEGRKEGSARALCNCACTL